MKSLLDAIGIKSYYTLVRAGEDAPSLIEDFPSNQFNHAIVCVPLKSDTIWLECTDQQIPFGFLGTFTDDRKVLLISDTGGIVVKTRQYSLTDNTQVQNAKVILDEEGNAESSISTEYRGVKYDLMSKILRMDDFDKKNSIREKIKLAQFNLVTYRYNETKTINPSLVEELKINVPEYGSIKGGYLVFKPNFINRIGKIPLKSVQRKAPIEIKRSYSETDTITYLLNGKYLSDLKPVTFSLKSPYGEYNYKIISGNKKICYIRSLKLIKGVFPAINYDSFVDFLNRVLIEDNRQIIVPCM
jgi:hypothetical protein